MFFACGQNGDAANIRREDGRLTFDFVTPAGTVTDIELGVPVDINIENAVAALSACWLTGSFEPDAARDLSLLSALISFRLLTKILRTPFLTLL